MKQKQILFVPSSTTYWQRQNQHSTAFPKNRELDWLDQIYNIVLMGPSGIGKTFISAGLSADAILKGYKAYFRTMEEIINMLKMKDYTATAPKPDIPIPI